MEQSRIPNLKSAITLPLRWMRSLYEWVLGWANHPAGSSALGIISFAESSFFPVPPDPLMCAMCLGARKRSFLFATITTCASVLGGVFGWILGMYFFDSVVLWFVETFGLQTSWFGSADAAGESGNTLQLDSVTIYPGGYLHKAHTLFNEWGFFAMFAAALTPIPYKVATIASGIFSLSLPVVILGSLLGRGLRFFSEATLLFFFAERAKAIIDRHFGLMTILLVVLLFAGFAAVKYLL